MAAAGVIIISPDGLFMRLLDHAGTWDAIFYRSLFMGITFTLVLLWQHRAQTLNVILGIGRRGVLAVFALTASNMGFVAAITHTTVANTLVILAIMPLFSALLGWMILGERVANRTWWAIFAGFFGVVIIFADSLGGGTLTGDVLALFTAILQALTLVILRIDGERVMVPAFCLSGFLAATISSGFADPAAVPVHDVALLAVLGVFIVPAAFLLFFSSVRYIPAAEASLMVLLETVLGPIWVWLVIGEVPTVVAAIGGIVIIGAIAGNSIVALRSETDQ
ncbi:MAG: DMT family transporter [Rhodospirillaceae bacterium]|nr:DMT family transporter [Rhodospirillaceae bacterium]MBT5034871.1 DMT family transporter [Rhodospirillaceae bacterium]MBT6219517.1 DMT family transporter [Rhodospirillaceae bacterium]MBT7770771.1 DMT family transporter [Rhodospirillales bacterium]